MVAEQGRGPVAPDSQARTPHLATYSEAARVLRCSYRTVQRRVAAGQLEVFRNGSRAFVTARSLRAFLQANTR
jgi:excisionase family DNA binding protein